MTAYDEAATRPRGARMPRKERRVQLLESALEVFVAQGYHAAAMDDIAERAGVSKPVLYQHFPGKLDLYTALLDASCDAIIDNCRAALQSTHDNKLRVAAAMEAFYEYIAGHDGAFRLVFESDLTNEPAVRAAVDRVTSECAEMIAARDPRRHRPARRRRQAARRVAGGNGAGQCAVLGDGRGWHQPTRRRGAGLRPGLARDPRLPAHRRALTHPPPTPHSSRSPMEIKIGVQHSPRELVVESGATAEEIEKQVADALAGDGLLVLTDTRGRRVLVPVARLTYVEIGGGVSGQVGFRS